MQWQEHQTERPGPKMLMPMAWSLLPLAIGSILIIIRGSSIFAAGLLSLALLLSMASVAVGSALLPGRLDMLYILPSPFAAIVILMQLNEVLMVVLAISSWYWDYRNASFLSRSAGTVYLCEWDPNDQLVIPDDAVIKETRWAPRILYIHGDMTVRGIRFNGKSMLEADRNPLMESE